MTGVAVRSKDKAGGVQREQANVRFRIGGDPVVTVGDTVERHGDHAPAPAMVEGEPRFRVGGRQFAAPSTRRVAAMPLPAGSGSGSYRRRANTARTSCPLGFLATSSTYPGSCGLMVGLSEQSSWTSGSRVKLQQTRRKLRRTRPRSQWTLC
jgi:hypothetical protein